MSLKGMLALVQGAPRHEFAAARLQVVEEVAFAYLGSASKKEVPVVLFVELHQTGYVRTWFELCLLAE